MEDPRKKDIVISDFFERGVLDKRLIYDEGGQNNVKKLGELFTESLEKEIVDDRGRKKKIKINAPLTVNQIRKYYDSFLKIYYSQVDEDTKKIQLLMLKANSEYSSERLSTFRFGIFMNNRINIVIKKSGEEFQKYLDAFKLHFEALVGYYPKDKKERRNTNE